MDFSDEIATTQRRLDNQREYLQFARKQRESWEEQIATHLMEINRLKRIQYRLERNDI